MKIKIGLCTPNPGWEIVLSQEGFCFEIIEKDFDLEQFALVIPNCEFVENNKNLLLEYITKNGLILTDKETFPILLGIGVHKRKISYIIPKKNSLFSHLGLVDFYSQFGLPNNNSLQILDEDLHIYDYSNQSGNVAIVSFSINDLILSQSSVRKRFYAERKELPSEVVSIVSKGKIRELISRIILQNFFKLTIPLVQKWYYPSGTENAFIFRIDTDFCSAEDAMNLYALCEKYTINATWFVDTQDEKMLSEVYSSFTQHEIALHCENHKVYKSYEENYNNILFAQNKLIKCGIAAKGFAAPFGEWNASLGKAIEYLDFEYSSEFTLDYDDLPFYPFFDNHFSSVLQIPIHPVSVGRLRRAHFTDQEMVQYYKSIIDYNFSRNLPVILYHHPHHKKLNVWGEIFAYIKTKNFWNPTMHEFAKWWNIRSSHNFSYTFSDGKISVNTDNAHDVDFRLLDFQKGSAVIHSYVSYKIDELSLNMKLPVRFNEKKSMRQYHWRDSLNNYEQRKAKKKQ